MHASLSVSSDERIAARRATRENPLDKVDRSRDADLLKDRADTQRR